MDDEGLLRWLSDSGIKDERIAYDLLCIAKQESSWQNTLPADFPRSNLGRWYGGGCLPPPFNPDLDLIGYIEEGQRPAR